MIVLIAAIGWGLLAFGAITHVWHQDRLRELLGLHFDHATPLAIMLTAAEVAIAVAVPVTHLLDTGGRTTVALIGAVLGLVFVGWILRLLMSRSELPCACSFSDAPTTVWSLGRAVCTTLVGLLVFADPVDQHIPTTIASLLVGLSLAGAVFLLPESIAWPSASRAMMARIDVDQPGRTNDGRNMSEAGLAVTLAVALAGLGLVLNHLQARLSLLEVTLNDGLPPGHEIGTKLDSLRTFDAALACETLHEGVHIFVSRSCHACHRLIEDFDQRGIELRSKLSFRYVDSPRPIAHSVGEKLGAEMHLHQAEITELLGIDPLPHTVAIGSDGLVTHGTTPTVADVVDVARNVGISAPNAEWIR